MENKNLKWIIIACVAVLIAIVALLAYVYKDKLVGLFGRAGNPTLDWGGYHQGVHPYYPCLAPVRTQLGGTFNLDTEERFKLYNRGTIASNPTTFTLSSDKSILLDSGSVTVSSGTYSNGVWNVPSIQPGKWEYIRIRESNMTAEPFSLGIGSITTECRSNDYFPVLGSGSNTNNTNTTTDTTTQEPAPAPINNTIPTKDPSGTDLVPTKDPNGTQPDGATVKGVTVLEKITNISSSVTKGTTGDLILPPEGTTTSPPSGTQCATSAIEAVSLAVSGRVLKNEAVVNVAAEGTQFHCVTLRFTIFKLGPNDEVLPYSAQDDIETKEFNLGYGTHYLSLAALPCSFQSDLYFPNSSGPIAYDWYEHGCAPPPTQALTCSPANQNIAAGASATFTATGGDGTYTWDTTGDNPTKPPTGPSATFTYGAAGSYTTTVYSGGATATCNVTVTGGTTPDPETLTCSPATQNGQIGKPVSFSATYNGGGLTYRWEAPEGNPSSGLADKFTTTYSTGGQKTVTVYVGSLKASCVVQVSSEVALVCEPASQTTQVNREVTVTAKGGNGSYTWSAPEGNPPSGSGSSFRTSFATPTGQLRSKIITVTSGGQTANCGVTVDDITTTQEQADLVITKTVSNSNPIINTQVIYTITITNKGPNNATGVTVKDGLPIGPLTYISSVASQGSYSTTDGIWSVGALNVGSAASLLITMRTNQVGTFPNTAIISSSSLPDPDSSNNQATATITVGSGGGGGGGSNTDIGVTKNVSSSSPSVGSNVMYTMTATNNGPLAATNVTFNDVLPSGVGFVSSNPSVGSYSNATGVWTIGDMAVGAVATLRITVSVNQSGTVNNTITLSNVSPSDSNTANNQATATFTTASGGGGGGGGGSSLDIAVTKSVNNTTVNLGGAAIFTVTAFNNGPLNATNLSIRDVLPSGATFNSATPSVGSYSNATGIWTIGSLNSGSSATLQLNVTINQSGTTTNTASLNAVDQSDSNSSNNQASASVTVSTGGGGGGGGGGGSVVTDVGVSKMVNNSAPAVGGQVIFTINVVNNGPLDATSIVVSDNLPNQVRLLKATASQGSYDSGSGLWSVGNISVGGSATLLLTVAVTGAGDFSNTSTITSVTPLDNNPSNNTSTVTLTSKVVPGLPAAGLPAYGIALIGGFFVLLALFVQFATPKTKFIRATNQTIQSKIRYD